MKTYYLLIWIFLFHILVSCSSRTDKKFTKEESYNPYLNDQRDFEDIPVHSSFYSFFNTPIDTALLDTMSIDERTFTALKNKYYIASEYHPDNDTPEHEIAIKCKNGKTFNFHNEGGKYGHLTYPIMKLNNQEYRVVNEANLPSGPSYWFLINLNTAAYLQLRGEPVFNHSFTKFILTEELYTDGCSEAVQIWEKTNSTFKLIYSDYDNNFYNIFSLFWVADNVFVASANNEKFIKARIKK